LFIISETVLLLAALQEFPEAARVFINIGRKVKTVERQIVHKGIEPAHGYEILGVPRIVDGRI
jgi:hypothetical protein